MNELNDAPSWRRRQIKQSTFVERISTSPRAKMTGFMTVEVIASEEREESQEDDDGCSSVNYGTNETQWMNGCYMGLRMRSNSLLSAEASHALNQHFDNHHEEAVKENTISMYNQMVNQHSSSKPSHGESYAISGLVVFDNSMLGQLDGRAFTERYGHIVNGFNCGVTSFMDEPFC